MTELDPQLTQEGFSLYRAGKVRRLTPTQFLVKTQSEVGSFLVEVLEGDWKCECGNPEDCAHRHAAQLTATATSLTQPEDLDLKCRYCGSSDISGCGYRYNAYGISKRIRCNECHRKFSIKQPQRSSLDRLPSETVWLLSEIGMVLNKLELLIEKCSLNFQAGASAIGVGLILSTDSKDQSKASRTS
jgi:hypothetical protein